ncbi:MAG: D-alanyl-D-alanine carboxypeptidase [Lachnospiraceae bacterium]|nr:D-alanyl-D-alanine carboxypeptidase [Lachnospiraceae bacterium]
MADFFIDRETEEYEERRRQRASRRADRAKQQREREKRIRRYLIVASTSAAVVIVAVIAVFAVLLVRKIKSREAADTSNIEADIREADGVYEGDARELLYGNEPDGTVSSGQGNPVMTELSDEELEAIEEAEALAATTGAGPLELNTTADQDTKSIISDVDSGYAILVSLSENRVLAERQSHVKMYPASMTKVLTVLVASEHLGGEQHLDDIFTMTQAIEGFAYENGCSNVGFSVGERIRVEDMFYGTILPSGADAAMGLAEYTAGDQETFVGMMNQKLEELGISDTTHFTNCIGIYDDDHYSTAADMAVIMNAAVNDPLCLKVLSQHTYTTTSTSYHPGGIQVSNWFLRRIEDKQETGVVISGKTGFVNESLNCAVSYATDDEGKGYICCTGYAHGGWKAIYDHVRIYTYQFDPALYNATLALGDSGEESGDIEGGD